ncbi:response regulator [Leptolyngbya ohadii]|uniref:response regulator n=1 Tax=Leptolyngbya ohadii TaxID=1962290 RepID=UPI000B59FF08|nr:response regulator [Leptolyngbya ohadii]
MKILLVEDDSFTREAIAAMLTSHHHAVDQANDGQMGLELVSLWNYDLILLDVDLPKLTGIQLCKQLRSQGCTVPILMLTVHGSDESIVQGLDAGADDYVVKPCEPAQLLARIRAISRRGGTVVPSALLTWGNLSLDPAAAEVTYHQQPISLSAKEYSLLELFLRHPKQIFNRDAILDRLWSIDATPTEKAVTNLVKDLRHKLKAGGMAEEIVATVYGLGYRLTEEPQKFALSDSEPLRFAPESLAQEPLSQNGERQINEQWDKWQNGAAQLAARFQASLEQRLAVLEAGVQAAQTNTLDDDRRRAAKAEAHRLAGALGTFGYEQGSVLARAIEQILEKKVPVRQKHLSQLSQLLTDLKQSLAQPATSPQFMSPQGQPSEQPSASAAALPQDIVILVLDADPHFTPDLKKLLPQAIQTIHARDWTTAFSQNLDSSPALILLNLDWVKAPDGMSQWHRLKRTYPDAKVLILADQDHLPDRVLAAQLGSDRYIVKTAERGDLSAMMTQVITQFGVQTRCAQVLILDDDKTFLRLLTHLLKPWGLEVTGLSDPTQFWDLLTTVNPDLLLLDVEMPGFSGLELCRVVRQDAYYGDMPILVITAHIDREWVQQVFAAGADDMITKPVVGPELVTRVLSRIERSRSRQRLDQLHRLNALSSSTGDKPG